MKGRGTRWSLLLLMVANAAFAQQAIPAAFAHKVSLNIPSQPIAGAIRELGQQSGLSIVIESQLGRDIIAPAVVGSFTPAEALQRILPSQLHAKYLDDTTVAVLGPDSDTKTVAKRISANQGDLVTDLGSTSDGPVDTEQSYPPVAVPSASNVGEREREKTAKRNMEEVVVTGSHIHGEPADSSQVIVYDRQMIEQSGAVTLEDFSRQMPENFASVGTLGGYSSTINGTGRQEGGDNISNGAGFNLHGLGAAATLTLINGHRIASAGASGQFVDISLIPLSAIERIEVLPDGASAIYGSDAVAGVVNIILRSDYDGAESTVRAGGATRSGDREATASQVLGRTWSGGSALVAYEYNRQNGLRANQRDFIPIGYGFGLGDSLLYPQQTRNSVLMTGSQSVGVGTTLTGDLMYSQREYSQDALSPQILLVEHSTGKPTEYGATVDLSHEFLETWTMELSPSFYRTNQPIYVTESGDGFALTSSVNTRIDLAQVHLHADGPIGSISGGAVKAAVGAEIRRERLSLDSSSIVNGIPGLPTSTDTSRTVSSAFAEFLVPIVGQDNGRVGLRRFELSVAARYDHYSTGESAATPRISLLWSPHRDLTVHASYANAFVAPRLDQLAVSTPEYYASFFPDPTSSSGQTDVLDRIGGNQALKPERSRTFTFGLDEKPSSVPGMTLSAFYFNTVFKNQILSPPAGNDNDILHDPTVQPFVNLSPNLSEVAQLFASGAVADYSGGLGASGVQATLDSRFANLAISRQSGVDVSTAYSKETLLGTVGMSISGTYLIGYESQAAYTVPAVLLLNRLGEPVNLRANAILSWSAQGISTALSVHYVNHYENPLFNPAESISSWTTADFHIAYDFHSDNSIVLQGVGIALNIRNVFDRAPPAINLPPTLFTSFNPGFDGANADPLGRVITLQLRKRW